MDLPTLIRLGSLQSEQTFGSYQRTLRRKTGPVLATCALGAAYLALVGRLRRRGDPPTNETLEAALPALTRDWPVTERRPCLCPIYDPPLSVKRMIAHLNDAHGWSREKIADLLDAEGIA